MKTKLQRLIIAGLSLSLAALQAPAKELTVDQIVEKANDAAYYAGSDGRAYVTMTITDAKGNNRVREFTILRLNGQNKAQKFYVYFEAPADVRKMAYLVWKQVDKDDDRWLWLPALNLVKRIAPGDKRTSFVGSDFVYEDVSGRSLNADTHELKETTATHYIINNTPKDTESVEFSSYTVHINKETFLPEKAEYLDKNGALYRTVEATRTEKIGGYPTVVESVVKDLKSGGQTKNVFSRIQYDIGLNDMIFTERFLRRPPREITP